MEINPSRKFKKMNWETIFDDIDGERNQYIDEDLISFQSNWNKPLSEKELIDLRENNQKPASWKDINGPWVSIKFETWVFPQYKFPLEFMELIKEYSGCAFLKGEREFSVFGPEDLREMNIAYELPEYMQGAVSIGLDGSGNHIVFDMRAKSENNNYKVYGVHSGCLEWEDAILLAPDFVTFVNGTSNIDELMNMD